MPSGSRQGHTSPQSGSTRREASSTQRSLNAGVSSSKVTTPSHHRQSVPRSCRDSIPRIGTELGEVILGRNPGRESSDEITIYKSMGHAVEDVVTATLVYQAALAEGEGTPFAMELRG